MTRANELCAARKQRLTPRRRQVLEILLSSHQPLGAYDILAAINRDGEDVAPTIVYRALEFLLQAGLIHRIESRNAFVSCSHPENCAAAQFLICQDCERVAELAGDAAGLLAGAQDLGFSVDRSVIEITGRCAQCQQHGR